jgi:hypothetical protein
MIPGKIIIGAKMVLDDMYICAIENDNYENENSVFTLLLVDKASSGEIYMKLCRGEPDLEMYDDDMRNFILGADWNDNYVPKLFDERTL